MSQKKREYLEKGRGIYQEWVSLNHLGECLIFPYLDDMLDFQRCYRRKKLLVFLSRFQYVFLFPEGQNSTESLTRVSTYSAPPRGWLRFMEDESRDQNGSSSCNFIKHLIGALARLI